MATLALGIAGKAVGSAIGGSILGASASAIGGFIGSSIGRVVDQALFGQSITNEGQALDSLKVTTSTEGVVIPTVYGRIRVGGNIIWATDFRHEVNKKKRGGKGGGPSVTTKEHLYFASFAMGLCEGEITGIGRIWADGEPLDTSELTVRWYPGSETQGQDPLIVSHLGADRTPAYRGLAYIVFDDLPLEDFGNRIPQISVEVFRPLADPDTAEGMVEAVCMIPGSGEFALATENIQEGSNGATSTENSHAQTGATDAVISIDQLEALGPNVKSVSLVVSWFGDDLRAGDCTIRPGVETSSKNTSPVSWSVNGLDRGSAYLVSQDALGNPVYGGTPSDQSVIQAITELKARGIKVTFYPFILMEVPDGNTLPDPYSDNAATIGQPALPWRGRITCSPAPGYAGTVDKTATAATQIDAFFGNAQGSDFTVTADSVSWVGDPSDWGYRRMILHYAFLCALAGGVDAFLIGSELRGITQVRSGGTGPFPGVDQLRTLAADARAIVSAPVELVVSPASGLKQDRGVAYQYFPPTYDQWVFDKSSGETPNWNVFTPSQPYGDTNLTVGRNTGDFQASFDFDVSGYPDGTQFTFSDVATVTAVSTSVPDWNDQITVRSYTDTETTNLDGSGNMVSGGTVIANRNLVASGQNGTVINRSITFTKPAGAKMIRIWSSVPGVYYLFSSVWRHVQFGQQSLVETVQTGLAKIGYAADWSEYHSYRPADGSGDVFFNLDPLWADGNIDFIGIDNYLPIADWRDGWDHLDAQVAGTIYDLDYLRSNIEGGEYFDWYYASDADRDAQIRSPITDGAYGKPWVFANKDLRSWWLNDHYDRPAGAESAAATSWTPQSKPIVFTEIGCPAVDRGPNQPNVFYDPKSSESALPHYSRGWRDDAVQRAYFEAVYGYWGEAANNPTSAVYGEPMIDMAQCAAWAWDARPYPFFPALGEVWADGANWRLGHWLTGRLGAVSLKALVRQLCLDAGLSAAQIDVDGLWGAVEGYAVTAVQGRRSSLEELARHFRFDGVESGGRLLFRMRARGADVTVTTDDLVAQEEGSVIELTRGQETELPQGLKWRVQRSDEAYDDVQVEARRPTVDSARINTDRFPFAVPPEEASRRCWWALTEAWLEMEMSSFALPPSLMRLDPGDVVGLQHDGRTVLYRQRQIADDGAIMVEAVRHERETYELPSGPRPRNRLRSAVVYGAPVFKIMDLPQITESHSGLSPLVAAWAKPWPGEMALWRGATVDEVDYVDGITVPATVGALVNDLPAGPVGRFDHGNEMLIDLADGALASVSDEVMFAGANAFAIEAAPGQWEVVQAATAELVQAGRYRLTRLLRGQRGTEAEMGDPAPAGAAVVLLETSLFELPITRADIGIPYGWHLRPATSNDPDAFTSIDFTAAGLGLRTFPPAHPRAQLDSATGAIELGWIRQDRKPSADSWNVAVPMSEDAESYELEILSLDGTTVLRTVTDLSTPSYSYAQADQTADYGAPVGTLRLRLYQIGALGRGTPLETTLSVTEAT
ncbi:MAG: baseplate multidomain protein megatron [Paracoccaceae bacterium]